MNFIGNEKHYRWAPERRRLPSIWRRVLRSDRPKHSGSVFAARCTLYACRHRLVNGYLTQMAPGDTTVDTAPKIFPTFGVERAHIPLPPMNHGGIAPDLGACFCAAGRAIEAHA